MDVAKRAVLWADDHQDLWRARLGDDARTNIQHSWPKRYDGSGEEVILRGAGLGGWMT